MAKYPDTVAAVQDLFAQKDRSASTLTAGIDDSTLSVPVADGTRFIAYEVISIDDEQMIVESIDGNTLTIVAGTRGWDWTVPAPHNQGAAVRGQSTAYHHNALTAEVIALEGHTAPVYNVKGYGAKGDGVTDDTAAIQAVITGCGAASGGEVVFPDGTYLVTATLTAADYSHLTLRASGHAVIKRSSGSTNILEFTSSTVAVRNSVIGLRFDATGMTGGFGLLINNQNTFVARDLYFSPVPNGIAVTGANTFNVFIENVNIAYILAGTGEGIRLDGGGGHHISDTTINGDPADQPLYGIRIAQSSGFYIDRTHTMQAGNGLALMPGSGQTVTWGWVTDSDFDTGDGYGILVNPAAGGIVNGINFLNTWTGSGALAGILCGTTGTTDGVRFIAHRSVDNVGDGAYLMGGQNILFEACTMSGNSFGAPGSSNGLTVAANVGKFVVNGGTYAETDGFANTQGYGIVVAGGASDNYQIIGAVLAPNVTGAMQDGGTGLNKAIVPGLGTSNVIPSLWDPGTGTIDLLYGNEPMFVIPSATVLTTITRGWIGRQITLIFTNASPGGVATGGNIARSRSVAQNELVVLVFDGTIWYHDE